MSLLTGKFTRNTLFFLIAKVSVFLGSVFWTIIIARLLGPSGKGIVSLTMLVPSFTVLLVSFGIGISNVYFIGQKKYDIQGIINNSVFSSLAIGLPAVLLLWVFAPYITSSFLKGVPPSFLRVACFLIPLEMLKDYLSRIMLGRDKFKSFAITKSLGASFLILFVCLLVFRFNILRALIAYIIASLGEVIVCLIFVRERKYKILPMFNKSIFSDSIRFGIKAQVGSIFQYFNYRFDVFIVNWFLSASAVGYYTVAVAIAELIFFIPDSLAWALFPRVSSSDTKTANKFAPQVFRHTMLLTSIAAFIIFILSKPLILLVFGQKFIPSVKPLQVLLPGIVAMSLRKVTGGYLSGIGKPEYNSYCALISLGATIFLDFLLIPKIGIIGASLATTVSYTLSCIVGLFWVLRESGTSLLNIIVPKQTDLFFYREQSKILLKNLPPFVKSK